MHPVLLGVLLMSTSLAHAAVQTREIPYQSADGSTLIGYYAWDDAIEGPRPAVVVVHEWWGLNDYAKRRARDLAALGYSALAIDMYGQGRNTEHPEDAKAFAQAASADAAVARGRFLAGLELLKQQPQSDAGKLAAIGYCFGGRVVLDMARQGVALAGVVSFHGALRTTTPATPGSVKARVLVAHGAADSFISAEDIATFKQEMQQAGVDYRFHSYPDAKHSFTNPDAGSHATHGLDVAYNRDADQHSWADMQAFFRELFAQP